MTSHPRVKNLRSRSSPIIIHKDHERFSLDFPFVEFGKQPSHVVVDIGDHPEKLGDIVIFDLANVTRLILGANIQRRVRRIGGGGVRGLPAGPERRVLRR